MEGWMNEWVGDKWMNFFGLWLGSSLQASYLILNLLSDYKPSISLGPFSSCFSAC